MMTESFPALICVFQERLKWEISSKLNSKSLLTMTGLLAREGQQLAIAIVKIGYMMNVGLYTN